MPTRPKHRCSYPHCPSTIAAQERYCEYHHALVCARYDANRETATARGYDTRWQKVRAIKLGREPLCQCGCGKLAECVHHLDRNPKNNDIDNLMSMATECHSKIHAIEDGLGKKILKTDSACK